MGINKMWHTRVHVVLGQFPVLHLVSEKCPSVCVEWQI